MKNMHVMFDFPEGIDCFVENTLSSAKNCALFPGHPRTARCNKTLLS